MNKVIAIAIASFLAFNLCAQKISVGIEAPDLSAVMAADASVVTSYFSLAKLSVGMVNRFFSTRGIAAPAAQLTADRAPSSPDLPVAPPPDKRSGSRPSDSGIASGTSSFEKTLTVKKLRHEIFPGSPAWSGPPGFERNVLFEQPLLPARGIPPGQVHFILLLILLFCVLPRGDPDGRSLFVLRLCEESNPLRRVGFFVGRNIIHEA